MQLTTGGILLNEECKTGGKEGREREEEKGKEWQGKKYVERLIGRDKVYENGKRSKPYES